MAITVLKQYPEPRDPMVWQPDAVPRGPSTDFEASINVTRDLNKWTEIPFRYTGVLEPFREFETGGYIIGGTK